jgi:5-methyltetrahydropteroyltriglutamate--homocysteine methyltransferase
MTVRTKPPFRADHVGSLLRPQKLKDARVRFLGPDTDNTNIAPHSNADLAKVEDECVREVVALQKAAGLRDATDGEFRRRSWWLELPMTWEGFTATRQGASPFGWKNEAGKQQDFSVIYMSGKIKWKSSAIVRAFTFLRDAVGPDVTPKVTIPAPLEIHCFMGGEAAIEASDVYDSSEEFWADLIAAYRQEVSALYEAGARYIQMDDCAIPFICDPDYAPVFRGWGREPLDMLREYAARMNEVLDGRPDDLTITMHQCRGNREGLWAAAGGYDPVAEVLFNEINVDGYFLEYDTERAGGFEPLRFMPAGKVAALGMVSTKTPKMETKDELKRRIEAATKFAPVERLSLTTQCGFASSVKGNPVTEGDEKAKLALIVETASEVWADA